MLRYNAPQSDLHVTVGPWCSSHGHTNTQWPYWEAKSTAEDDPQLQTLMTLIAIREKYVWKAYVTKGMTDCQQRCGLALVLLEQLQCGHRFALRSKTNLSRNNTVKPKTNIRLLKSWVVGWKIFQPWWCAQWSCFCAYCLRSLYCKQNAFKSPGRSSWILPHPSRSILPDSSAFSKQNIPMEKSQG